MHMYAFVKTHQTIHSKCVHYVNYANHISIFLFKGALLPKPSKNKFQRPDDLGTHLEFFLCLHIVSRSQFFFFNGCTHRPEIESEPWLWEHCLFNPPHWLGIKPAVRRDRAAAVRCLTYSATFIFQFMFFKYLQN